MAGITAFYNIKADASSHMLTDFLLYRHIRDCPDLLGEFPVAENPKFAVIFSLIHTLAYNADKPDDPKYMVYVLMGHEDIVDIADVNASIF